MPSAHDIRRIAVVARRDPRTVHRVLSGAPRTSDMARLAILEAARELGIELPATAHADRPAPSQPPQDAA